MKRIMTIFMALMAIIAMPLAISFSQVVSDGSTALVIGARYETKTLGTYGLAQNLWGKLWLVPTVDIAKNKSANVELMVLFKLPIGERFYGGFVGGPNNEWQSQPGDTSVISYLKATAGIVGTYGFSDRVGIGGYLKQIYPLEDNLLVTDWVGGVAFYFRI